MDMDMAMKVNNLHIKAFYL